MCTVLTNFRAPICVVAKDAGKRLDQFLAERLKSVSRSRIQQFITAKNILVNNNPTKASIELRGGETITILEEPATPPLKAAAEEIPLDIVYEDRDLAVVNKPAGMMVHAGAGASDDARNRGTLVNALLHHMKNLSAVGGELRPGIVHRLDKETSGLIVVAKNDEVHRKLAAQFAAREVKKKYIALVHGWVKKDSGTIDKSISRDRVRRTRMTTRASGGRTAVTHFRSIRRVDTKFGKFTLLDVKIDTGRTHQIRVHLSSSGHPVVGDSLYGAPRELKANLQSVRNAQGKLSRKAEGKGEAQNVPSLPRNFLHAAELEFRHPRSGQMISLQEALPQQLQEFLTQIESA